MREIQLITSMLQLAYIKSQDIRRGKLNLKYILVTMKNQGGPRDRKRIMTPSQFCQNNNSQLETKSAYDTISRFIEDFGGSWRLQVLWNFNFKNTYGLVFSFGPFDHEGISLPQ